MGQTDLTIELNTEKNITGSLSQKIKYKKPNGLISEWTADVVNASSGIIKYNVIEGDLDVAGKWTVWAKIIDSEGLISIGEPSDFTVYKEGT